MYSVEFYVLVHNTSGCGTVMQLLGQACSGLSRYPEDKPVQSVAALSLTLYLSVWWAEGDSGSFSVSVSKLWLPSLAPSRDANYCMSTYSCCGFECGGGNSESLWGCVFSCCFALGWRVSQEEPKCRFALSKIAGYVLVAKTGLLVGRGAGRNLQVCWFHTQPRQGRPEQGAQHRAQMALGCLWGWRLRSCSGHLVPVLSAMQSGSVLRASFVPPGAPCCVLGTSERAWLHPPHAIPSGSSAHWVPQWGFSKPSSFSPSCRARCCCRAVCAAFPISCSRLGSLLGFKWKFLSMLFGNTILQFETV